LALQIRQIQLKLDQFGAIQQRLIAHLMANSPTKQCSANDEGKKPVGNNRLQNTKLIPRARIRPISCSAPTNNSGTFPQAQNANNSQQNQRLRSSPNIPVPQAEFATSTATANFTLFEEEMAENGSMLLEEEEENGQQQIWVRLGKICSYLMN
jgi:hypothetical protein